MKKGFTMIELLVVIGIIVIFTGILLPNYRSGNRNLALQRSVHKLSQDIRRAQGFAISAKEFNGQSPDGYGVYFDSNNPTKYIIFADLNNDDLYSGPSELVETVNMETQVSIKSIYPNINSTLTIFFSPPDPTVIFTPNSTSTATVILTAPDSPDTSVHANEAGLIYVD